MISRAVWTEPARQPSSVTDSYGIKCAHAVTTMPKREISSKGAAKGEPTRSPTRLTANPASVEVDRSQKRLRERTSQQSEKCEPKGTEGKCEPKGTEGKQTEVADQHLKF